MRFKPTGARTLQHYAFIVITETDEDRRATGSKAEYLDYFHTGQIIICDVTGGQPIEVATHTKPGHLDCEWEQFEVLGLAIDYSHLVTGSFWKKSNFQNERIREKKKRKIERRARYKPAIAPIIQDYAFVVITETEEEKVGFGAYRGHFYTGQIAVCNVTSGTPVEVGTFAKPASMNCRYEEFGILDQAIEYAYMVTESGWDHKRERWTEKGRPRRRPKKKLQKEGHRKFRHRA